MSNIVAGITPRTRSPKQLGVEDVDYGHSQLSGVLTAGKSTTPRSFMSGKAFILLRGPVMSRQRECETFSQLD